MENSVLTALIHMVAPLNALQITINVQPEPTQTTARSKLYVLHAQKIITVNVALHLLIAQLSANLMRRNALHPEKMIMAAPFLLNVLSKKEIITENFAPFIAPLTVTMMKHGVLAKETKWDVLSQINV